MPTPANANVQYKQEIIDIVPSLSNKRSIVLIGDSYVAQELHADPNNTADKGTFHILNSLLGSYFEIISISGVGGETLDLTRARFQTDVINLGPGFFWLYSGGLNDVVSGRTASAMFADVKWMIETAIQNGIFPIIPALPLAQGMWGIVDAPSQRAKLLTATTFQSLMSDFASTTERWLYLSMSNRNVTDQAYTDGTTGEYLPRHKAVYDADTTHFTAAGSDRAALDGLLQVKNLISQPELLPIHYNDSAAGCWNPLMLVGVTPSSSGIAGGAVTGTVPDGWYNNTSGGSAVISQVPRTDIDGANWNQAVCTGLASNQLLDLLESDPAAFNYIFHKFTDHGIVAGDIIVFFQEYKMTGVTGTVVANGEINSIATTFHVTDVSNADVDILIANKNPGTTAPIFEGSDYSDEVRVISTIRYTVPANATGWGRVRTQVNVRGGASGLTDFTFSQGRTGMRKVSS